MIKFKRGNITIFGLSEGNIERLKEDKPIKIDMSELGGDGYIYIYYGETEKDLVKWLEDQTGINLIINYAI